MKPVCFITDEINFSSSAKESDLKTTEPIKQISGGSFGFQLVTESGKLLRGNSTSSIEEHDIGVCVSTSCGYTHGIALNSKGEVFGYGSNGYGQIVSGNTSSLTKPKKIEFFTENKNLFVQKVVCGVHQTYFLIDNGDLYGAGLNSSNELGVKDTTKSKVVFIKKNITDVYSGNYSHFYFRKDTENNIFGNGQNLPSQNYNLKEQKEFANKQIMDISTGYRTYIVLCTSDNNEQSNVVNELWRNFEKKFTRIKYFDHIPLRVISEGCWHTILQSKDRKVYGWDQNYNENCSPKEIEISKREEYKDYMLDVVSGSFQCYFLFNYENYIVTDVKNLFAKHTEFSDFSLLNEIKTFKSIIECRTRKKFDQVKDILESFNIDQVKEWLKWCHKSENHQSELTNEIFEKLGITNPHERTIQDDLLWLYSQEDTKDFRILIKDQDDDDDDYDDNENNDEDDSEEDNYEEIPIHKTILIARSGLFREMFKNITEKSNSVKDFSGKSIESLEIFFQFLYTDKIELTADNDPQLIADDLADAAEYYQLTTHSILEKELEKVRKMF
ncbi:hypothetical protein M0813_05117 [Anaeramoeba flamelloides]|uniref:BTB domain-containing protein n=1 Tax=Anaeramoeba flamelloides TaxID=1746091 RepID=A0ABQ8XHT0_9EUKA|nr:hypothetical protein M0813_05117 [Anaeramoeba flamelloides]